MKFWTAIIFTIFLIANPIWAQGRQVMEVQERDPSGKAQTFNFDFSGGDLKNLIDWLSKEADLIIIASENDIKDKKFALTNLRNVTIDQTLEKIKTVLSQYNLTMIRDGKTVIITTFERATQMRVPVKRIGPDPSQVEVTDEIRTYIIELKSAVASELANSIKPLLNKSANVFADATSNSLAITEVSSNVQRIVSILAVADEAPETPLKVAIIPLTNAEATSLARTLGDLFKEEGEQKPSAYAGDPEKMREAIAKSKETGEAIDMLHGIIQISADQSSNSLIVKASEVNVIAIRGLIEQLDTTPDIQTEIKIFQLGYAVAEDVADTLSEILTGMSAGKKPGRNAEWWEMREYRRNRDRMKREGRQIETQGIVGEVNISADDRLNAIIISSDPRNFSLLEKIITELDQADPANEMKLYFLKNADAATLEQNLQDLFEGTDSSRDQDLPWWARNRRENRGGGGDSGFGVQGDVHIVSDQRLNALLISTSNQNFATIDQLIKDLDVSMPDQEWATRFYTLKFADAENVADIINTLYQGSSSSRGFSFFDFLPSRNRNQNQGSLAGNVMAEAYPTLNAIIVSTATQRNFDLVEEFIKSIDVQTPDEQREVTRFIRLEYATASEISDILNDVWEGEDSGGFSFRRFLSSGGRMEQKDINSLRGKVTINADEQTNSLIVTTLKRYIPDVEELIAQLDFVRGQVWIDIQILEVSLDEDTKLGLEITATEKGIFGAELTDKNPLIGSIDTKLGLDAEISGFNYRLATSEYIALLHTLMRENRVKTLSTPSLLTRDNQQATWSRGRQIPFLQSVSTTNVGQGGEGAFQPLYNYDFITPPVGINIDITPHIAKSKATKDGKRTIGLEIHNIQASNFIEFTEFNAPITEDSSISAYIDVEDGQTILVGGMIKTKQQDVESKVPFLGDIPFLGRLFRKTEKVIENSEIVIIITPHIVDIRDPKDLENLQKRTDEWRSSGENGSEEK